MERGVGVVDLGLGHGADAVALRVREHDEFGHGAMEARAGDGRERLPGTKGLT